MKKKFFAIYALIGAMAVSPIFTSCVDSEETPSVEALRNAKAEELKAIADLNNAKAASTTAMAAADAALLNAKAEAQKAQNKLTEARTAWYETQNEAERAALEVTIKQAEADLARIQGEIDAQAINVQAALMYAQKQLLQAKQELEEATEGYEAYEKAKLQNLANEYSWAVSDLIWYQKRLAAEKAKLTKLEAGLLDAEKALAQTIEDNTNTINLNNIQIESLKQYTNYTADVDALKQQMDAAWNAYLLAEDKYYAADEEVNEAYNYMDVTERMAAEEAVLNDDFYTLVNRNEIYDAENEKWISTLPASDFISFSEEDWHYQYEYVIETENNTYYQGYGDSLSIKYELTADIRQIELVVTDETDWRKAQIKDLTDAITANKAEYTKAVAATTAAKKAWDEAAEEDKVAKKEDYDAALYTELQWKAIIDSQEEQLADLTAQVAAFEKAFDMVKNAETHYTALMAKVKAYNDADKAMYAEFLETLKSYYLAQEAISETYAEYYAIYQIYNGYTVYDDGIESGTIAGAKAISNKIKELEDANEALKAEIEEAQKLLTVYDDYSMPYEVAIEFQKAKVAAQEAIVAAQEVKVEDLKKALEAAMPAEETPAE